MGDEARRPMANYTFYLRATLPRFYFRKKKTHEEVCRFFAAPKLPRAWGDISR